MHADADVHVFLVGRGDAHREMSHVSHFGGVVLFFFKSSHSCHPEKKMFSKVTKGSLRLPEFSLPKQKCIACFVHPLLSQVVD